MLGGLGVCMIGVACAAMAAALLPAGVGCPSRAAGSVTGAGVRMLFAMGGAGIGVALAAGAFSVVSFMSRPFAARYALTDGELSAQHIHTTVRLTLQGDFDDGLVNLPAYVLAEQGVPANT